MLNKYSHENKDGYLQEAKFQCERCNRLTPHERYESQGTEEDGRPFMRSGYSCLECGNNKFDHITRATKW